MFARVSVRSAPPRQYFVQKVSERDKRRYVGIGTKCCGLCAGGKTNVICLQPSGVKMRSHIGIFPEKMSPSQTATGSFVFEIFPNHVHR